MIETKKIKEMKQLILEHNRELLESGEIDEDIFNEVVEKVLASFSVDRYRKVQEIKREKENERIDAPEIIPRHKNMRAVPDVFLRSGLFSINQADNLIRLQNQKISCVRPYKIFYSGPLLNQTDLDVWMSVVYLGGDSRFDEKIDFTIGEILKSLHLNGTGKNSLKVVSCLQRLSDASIEVIEKKDKIVFKGKLIKSFEIIEKAGRHKRYKISLDDSISELYRYDKFKFVDWNVRNQLSGKLLSQWLHAYYSTHTKVYKLTIGYIYRLCGSRAIEVWKFKQTFTKSLEQLAGAWPGFSFEVNYRNESDDEDMHTPVEKQKVLIHKEATESQKNNMFMKDIESKINLEQT